MQVRPAEVADPPSPSPSLKWSRTKDEEGTAQPQILIFLILQHPNRSTRAPNLTLKPPRLILCRILERPPSILPYSPAYIRPYAKTRQSLIPSGMNDRAGSRTNATTTWMQQITLMPRYRWVTAESSPLSSLCITIMFARQLTRVGAERHVRGFLVMSPDRTLSSCRYAAEADYCRTYHVELHVLPLSVRSSVAMVCS